MNSGLRHRWQGLDRRERRAVVTGTAVVSLALLYALLVEPAWEDRSRIRADLPRLYAQLVEVEALAAEAKALRDSGGPGSPGPAVRATLERSLAAAGLQATVDAPSPGVLSVKARDVPAGQWWHWAEDTTRTTRLRVMRARIARAAAEGRVDAELQFSIP
ncbi:MAG: type II secretion system protein M [Betaproteobacteria bacterium]|nr:type II secretion system protein M [Betaproteobacteria bacterium]